MAPLRSVREELANAITHGLGLLASIAAGAVLVVLASLRGDSWQIVAVSIYAASLVILYSASTVYHAARSPELKARLKIFDHCAIFGLIAGTYTPFTLGAMRGGWGWTLFAVVWGLAVSGITVKLFFTGRQRLLSTFCYLAMGWMGLIALTPLQLALPSSALVWIVAGGLTYSVGTLFYLNRRVPYGHAIWHLFVLGGSACHFMAVLQQLTPYGPV